MTSYILIFVSFSIMINAHYFCRVCRKREQEGK